MADQDDLLVEVERIRCVLQQAPLTLLVTILNASLTTVVLAPVIGLKWLSIWVMLIVAVSGARWVVRQRFLCQAPDGIQSRTWAMLSIFGSLMTGALWGIMAVVLSPAAETYQTFFAFVIGGMCAGTTAVNSAHLPTVLAFILPSSLPLAASFVADGSVPRLISSLMIVVFASALSLSSFRAHCAFGAQLRLQLALSRQSHELSNTNERLRREVTDRQKVEATLQQVQKMEAIGHLTGGMAHDFNNILQVIKGNLSMIGRLASGHAQILGYVQAAEQAAQQSSALINSLLTFARRQSLQVERVDVNTLLQAFQSILLRSLGETIRFQMSLVSDLPGCNSDPAHFQSAILNLVINARDALPDGGEVLISTGVMTLEGDDLRANPDAKPGRFVSVSVQDNGSGMTAEVQAQVFEPFFTTKDVGKGSGLGLSQVYGFARQSGGHVNLRSTSGAGTCVTLLLPAVDE